MSSSSATGGHHWSDGWDVGKEEGYKEGYAAGYAAAKAEMVRAIQPINPVYVEGGRVPEEAIEHRNQPTFKDAIEKKGASGD